MKVRELIKRLQLLDQDKEIVVDYDTVASVEPIPIAPELLVDTDYKYDDCYVIIADSYVDKEEIECYRNSRDEMYMPDGSIRELILRENERQEELCKNF